MADAGRWKPYVQRQGQLLPAFVDDALDPSVPVFFIDDVVDGLELTVLEERYATVGEHAYDPRLLLKLWRYGATQGVYSGRERARRVRRDLAFRYLAGDGPVPDCRTMNRVQRPRRLVARTCSAAPASLAAACRSRVPRTRHSRVLPRAKT